MDIYKSQRKEGGGRFGKIWKDFAAGAEHDSPPYDYTAIFARTYPQPVENEHLFG